MIITHHHARPLAALLVGLLLASCGAPPQERPAPPKTPPPPPATEVVIIGTFHGMHFAMTQYHPDTLRHLLRIAEPDVLALELRPEDASLPDYGKAPRDIKQIVIPWAKKHDVPFRPIDWWEEGNREQHNAFFAELKQTEEGRQKLEQLPDEMSVHRDRCPEFDECTVQYIHSAEFAQRDRQVRRALTEAFGEGPGNLFWYTRAKKMSERLDAVLAEFPTRRVVVVTGAAHRGDLEQALQGREGVRLVPVTSLSGADQLPPYSGDEGGAAELELMLMQLVQGQKANRAPDKVNLVHLRRLLDRARALQSKHPELSTTVRYASAEAAFLAKDYDKALRLFEEVAKTAGKDEKAFGLPIGLVSALRAANMLDLLGKRYEAVQRYLELAERKDELGRLAAAANMYATEAYERPSAPASP